MHPAGRCLYRRLTISACIAGYLLASVACIQKKTGAPDSWASSRFDVTPGTINDFAGILHTGTRNRIAATLSDFNARSKARGIQLTVVTETCPTRMLNGQNLISYQNLTRERLDQMTGMKHVVLVLLVAPMMTNTNIYGIARDETLAKYLPMAESNAEILKPMQKDLLNGDEDLAILKGTHALVTKLATAEHIDPDDIVGLNPWYTHLGYVLALFGAVVAGIILVSKTPRLQIIVKRLLTTLFSWTCIGIWGTWIYLTFFKYHVDPVAAGAAMLHVVGNYWPPTDDGVLNLIIVVVAAIPLLIVIAGAVVVGFWVCAGLLGLAFVIAPLEWLAKTSVTGAVLAAVLVLVGLGMAVWSNREPLGRHLQGPADALFGIFFEWWLSPLLMRRKEQRLMNDVQNKRARYDAAVAKLRRDAPEISDIPISIAPETWIDNILEQIRQGRLKKTFAAQTETLTQIKQFYSEWRAALDAHDELTRAKSTYVEKDEDAENRRLERLKQKLVLERDVAQLKKQSEPPPPKPVDKRSPEQRIADRLHEWRLDVGAGEKRSHLGRGKPEPMRPGRPLAGTR